MNYVKDYITFSKYHRPGDKGEKESITVHNTGSPGAPAINLRKYLGSPSNTVYASFHITVDDKQAIECIPLDEVAYHCANTDGNYHSIGIEVCEIDGAEYIAAELIANMLKERNWGIDRVTTHQRWNGKNCPRLLLPKWGWFLNLIKEKMNYGGEIKLKNMIVHRGDPDKRSAEYLADYLQCSIIHSDNLTPEIIASTERFICVGPIPAPIPNTISIVGMDRFDTAVKINEIIRSGGLR